MFEKGALPYWIRTWWLCCVPVAVLFAGRILWETTAWTSSHGPRVVGFSLVHTYPTLFFIGIISSWGTAIWLLPGIGYATRRRSELVIRDAAMLGVAVFAISSLAVGNNFYV
jgi:hypothetical protein